MPSNSNVSLTNSLSNSNHSERSNPEGQHGLGGLGNGNYMTSGAAGVRGGEIFFEFF